MDIRQLFSVDGKIVLVTGGSRGIGEMIAAGFLAHGARVFISSRKAEVCDATAARLATKPKVVLWTDSFSDALSPSVPQAAVKVLTKAGFVPVGPADPAVREATEAVAIMLSLAAPYTAEEMWSRLGHEPTVATVGWPAVDEALLVQDSVTAIVQVQGKLRAKLEVSPSTTDDELSALALAEPNVQRAIDGREVRRVIVRAPKLVNVVV